MEEIDYLDEEVQLENGTVISVNFLRKYSYVLAPVYGADFDGNRGVPLWFLDEDDFTDVSVRCYKKFKDIDKLRKRNQLRIITAIDRWMTKNPPERNHD